VPEGSANLFWLIEGRRAGGDRTADGLTSVPGFREVEARELFPRFCPRTELGSWLGPDRGCLRTRKSTTEQNAVSETLTWTHFADFSRGACGSYALPIETDLTEFLYTRELVSDLIEIHGLDLNGPFGRTKDDKFLPLRSMKILYVFRKESSFEGCPVFYSRRLPNE